MIADEQLFEYAMGTLDPAEAAAVEDALAGSAALRAALTEIEALVGGLGQTLVPIQPTPAARDRLLAAVSTEEKWAPFLARVAKLMDLAESRMRAIFAEARDATRWEAIPIPGVQLFHFTGGPAMAGLDTGFIKVDAGSPTPRHRHVGDEYVFVLEGGFVDLVTGVTHGPGELIHHAAGTEHAFQVTEGADLVYAIVNGGLEIVM